MRGTISVALPAPNGMTARIGLCGQFGVTVCAVAPVHQAASTADITNKQRCMLAPSARIYGGREASAMPTSGLLRRHGRRAPGMLRRLGGLAQLRLEPVLEHAVDAVEIDVDHRRDEQREQLRDAEPANHGDPQWLTQFSAGAGAERDRQRAEDRGE